MMPVTAQKQSNIWYFGTGVGLDFNQFPPRPLNNNQANSQEGCASIADNNGKLLFYTNGIAVLNRKHEIMLNGNNLRGDLSSTSNTIIVPLPGNDSIYYLFTVGATAQVNKGLRYNIINIKGDGGFGEVIIKNTYVDEAYEKMAAVRHCNNRDVWITIRKWESDEYDSYLLTASGFNAIPVVSHTGLTIGGIPNNAIGTLKFSMDGKKIAAVHSTENDKVELMDFDNATGLITNPVILKPNVIPHPLSFTGVYAAEFSPNGNLLYVSANNSATDPCSLFQYNITSNDSATIAASKQIIAQPTQWFAGGLQTGPDLKIYMAMWKDTAISVIDNPDVYGSGCNFRLNKISFGSRGEPVQFGLPTLIQSDLNINLVPYDFTRSGNCLDKNVQFNINRVSGIDSVKWDFGDAQQSQALSPLHQYTAPGFYTARLTVFSTDCSGKANTTIQKTIWLPDATITLLGNDIEVCSFENLQLTVNITGVNYLWSNGSNNNSVAITSPGRYWVEIEQQGCKLLDTINIAVKAAPFVNIGKDTTVCSSQPVTLSSGNAAASAYLWSTGETTPAIQINKPGLFSVKVTENTCVATDTVNVVWGDCPFFIPNAFTPNDDNKNDYFGVLNGFSLLNFSMKIYNRYGQVIFSTNNISDKWDGKYKGKAMPVGAYPWSIIYVNGKGYTKWLSGTVLILH